jgi:hypothetical protein
MCSRFHRDSHRRQISEPPFDPSQGSPKPTSVYDFTFLVERSVMTPDIPKIDPDRHLDLGAAAWFFHDEVLRLLLHSHSLSLSRVTVSSHFSVNCLMMAS